MCEKREKRLDRSLPRSPRTRSASPPDARASPHAATWPVSGINSQLLTLGAQIGAPRGAHWAGRALPQEHNCIRPNWGTYILDSPLRGTEDQPPEKAKYNGDGGHNELGKTDVHNLIIRPYGLVCSKYGGTARSDASLRPLGVQSQAVSSPVSVVFFAFEPIRSAWEPVMYCRHRLGACASLILAWSCVGVAQQYSFRHYLAADRSLSVRISSSPPAHRRRAFPANQLRLGTSLTPSLYAG